MLDFTTVIMIILVAALIPVLIVLTILSRFKAIEKNTALTTNNIIELDKRQQERNEKLIAELQQQNELLKTLLQQKPTAQQAPENEKA